MTQLKNYCGKKQFTRARVCKYYCDHRQYEEPFEIFYRENLRFWFFSEFGRIAYVTKRRNIKKHTQENKNKAIIVGYSEKQARYTYMLYNIYTKRVIINMDIKWAE